jgi:hypothetical protein
MMKKKQNQEDKNEEVLNSRKKKRRSFKSTLIFVVFFTIGAAIFCYIIWPWIKVPNKNIPNINFPDNNIPIPGVGIFNPLIDNIAIIAVFILVALFVIWLLSGIRIVKPDEQGNKIFFGGMGKYDYPKIEAIKNPETGETSYRDTGVYPKGFLRLLYGYCNSGLHYVLRLPYCGIAKIPKKMFQIDYKPRITLSKDTDGNKNKQILSTQVYAYLQFGRDYNSVKNIIEKKIPTDLDGLEETTDGIVDDGVGVAIGSLDWRVATTDEGRNKIKACLTDRFIQENEKMKVFDNATITAGVKVVELTSEELKKSLASLESERIDSESAVFEAKRTEIVTGVLGKIRRELRWQGFNAKDAARMAHNIYELQTSSDLQRETRMPIVKLIRWQGGETSMPGAIAQIMTSAEIGREIQSDKTTTKSEGSGKEKTQEEKDEERGLEIMRKRGFKSGET